jgi:hypothetical protein
LQLTHEIDETNREIREKLLNATIVGRFVFDDAITGPHPDAGPFFAIAFLAALESLRIAIE